MYAIIETGGKQLRVEKGQVIWVEKLDVNVGDSVTFDKVVALSDGSLKIGNPYVESATVVAEVEKQGKGRKIRIFKYRPKSGSTHRRQGHRQPYTRLVVKEING